MISHRDGDHSSSPTVARLDQAIYPEVVVIFSQISDLRFKTTSGGQPWWRLPIWSCTARSLPGRLCYHRRRCALTLSPCGPHHFTHYPLKFQIWDLRSQKAGLLSVALVVARQSQISNLKS